MVQVKRIYDQRSPDDGKRFLVERLWPRGLKREELRLDAWLKDVAPSGTLRVWFGHDPKKWQGFQEKYFLELDKNPECYGPILAAAQSDNVTLLYSARDETHNNAVALKSYLEAKAGKERIKH